MKRRGFFKTLLAATAALICPIKAAPTPLKAGVYGWTEVGYCMMDARAMNAVIYGLPPGTKLPTETIESDETYVPFRTARARFLQL
jgi:hypothetical protein